MTTLAKLAAAFALVALGATGCAAKKDSTGSSEAQVRTNEDCISNLPIEVWSIAAHLDLGAPKTAEGAAGSTYFELTSGAVIRWSNVESKVSEVRLSETNELELEVALAASKNVLGAFKDADGAAGSIYYTFERGVVRWSNVESKVSEVTRTDGSPALPAKPLAAPTQVGTACLNGLPKPVWDMAAHLDLGPAIEGEGAAGSLYFTFSNGSVIRWSNVESKLSEVRLVASEGERTGTPGEIPLAVAEAAASRAFGSYVTSEGAAGSIYFTFDRGTVRWSNVESKVSEVLPK